MDIKSIWMSGFHIGYNHRNKHGSDWNDEPLFEGWKMDNSAMCEANSNAVLCAVPITVGDSYGVQFLCPECDFPKNDTLTMDMKYCWNCGIKLDWSEWEK